MLLNHGQGKTARLGFTGWNQRNRILKTDLRRDLSIIGVRVITCYLPETRINSKFRSSHCKCPLPLFFRKKVEQKNRAPE